MKTRICIISHARPDNVKTMEAITGPDVYWYVGMSDFEAYRAAGAKNVIVGGGLCESRNKALRDAFADGEWCLQISDDLKKLEYTRDGQSALPVTFKEVLAAMETSLQGAGSYHLCGVAPTPNLFYYNPNKPFSQKSFIVGDLILVSPCDIFFDEQLKLKEDYDYTVQHIKRYYGCVRMNGILATFAHSTNPGGAVESRTPDLERGSIEYLMNKHPGFFRMNPERENEILLKRLK